jgi:hypothetical protein
LSNFNRDTTFISVQSGFHQGGSSATNKTLALGLDTTTQLIDTSFVDSSSIQPLTSVLKDHGLKAINSAPLARSPLNTDWITVLILSCLIFLAYIKVSHGKRFQQMFYSFFSHRYQSIMERDGSIFKDRILIPLILIYTLSFSIFIGLCFWYFLPNLYFVEVSFMFIFYLSIIVLLLGFLKSFSIWIYGNMFKSSFIRSEIILSNYIFNMVFGILLFPVIILYIYIPSPVFLYIGFFLWLFTLAYKLLRQSLTRFSDTKFSYFNRFIYLCTFEIAPIAILIKLIMTWLQ